MVISPRSRLRRLILSPSTASSAACNWSSFMRSTRDGVFAADLGLQLQDAVEQRLRRGRAAGHVDIHRHDAVAAAHHGVAVVVVAATIGAGTHAEHPARL